MPNWFTELNDSTSMIIRIALIIGVALLAHCLVAFIRKAGHFLTSRDFSRRHPKMQSVSSLVSSVAIFAVYFTAIGFVLGEAGISLKAYLATATVIGLAVGFGSQGIVQDIVTGLTLVFSDLVDIGEMIEVSGQIGIVHSIGMRFLVIENAMGAQVFIPNRTIGNVINYPKGYVRCLVDIMLPEDDASGTKLRELARDHMNAVNQRYPNILVRDSSVEGEQTTSTGHSYLRLKFRIWPGRGGPLETIFKQEFVKAAQNGDPDFGDWMVSILYEAEKK